MIARASHISKLRTWITIPSKAPEMADELAMLEKGDNEPEIQFCNLLLIKFPLGKEGLTHNSEIAVSPNFCQVIDPDHTKKGL